MTEISLEQWDLLLQQVPPRKQPKQEAKYLEIRRRQNERFAVTCLERGNAVRDQYEKAKEIYLQGLELVPKHADLLVALGALEASNRRFDDGVRYLEKALEIDPDHPTASRYLQEIREYQKKVSQKESKAEAAMKDAALELALRKRKRKKHKADDSISSGDQSTVDSLKIARKKKKKKRRKK